MNVKNLVAVALLGILAAIITACSGAGPTPTRTPRAESATQTPFVVFVPVTNTPEPFTVTPLPTVTASKPTPAPTNTRKPVTPVPTRLVPTRAPTAIPASPTPACLTSGQVNRLYWPENGTTRNVSSKGGGGNTIQFKWDPITGQKLDSKIGYLIYIKAPGNSTALYVSHNGYLALQNGTGAVLDGMGSYYLTLPSGQDVQATWSVTVVQSDSGFDDEHFKALSNPVKFCGPASPPNMLNLHVIG